MRGHQGPRPLIHPNHSIACAFELVGKETAFAASKELVRRSLATKMEESAMHIIRVSAADLQVSPSFKRGDHQPLQE